MSDAPRHDLRLVPAAAAAWLAAAAGVLGSARAAAGALLAVLLVAAVAVVAVAPGRGRRRAVRPDPVRGGVGTGVLALGAAAAVLASCAGHLAAREHGPVATAAAERAVVVLEGVVVGDPRLDTAPWPTSTPVRAVVRVERLTARGRVGAGTGEVLVTGDAALARLPGGVPGAGGGQARAARRPPLGCAECHPGGSRRAAVAGRRGRGPTACGAP